MDEITNIDMQVDFLFEGLISWFSVKTSTKFCTLDTKLKTQEKPKQKKEEQFYHFLLCIFHSIMRIHP